MTSRILICDDESYITRAIAMKFSGEGLNVETVSDGRAALEAVRRETPDLMITDYQMPNLDGLELCERLRQEPETHAMPIVFLTAKGFELDLDEICSRLDISQVFVKPFSPRELLASVQRLLNLQPQGA